MRRHDPQFLFRNAKKIREIRESVGTKDHVRLGIAVVDKYLWYEEIIITEHASEGSDVIVGQRTEFTEVYTTHGGEHYLKAVHWARLELRKFGLTLEQSRKATMRSKRPNYVLARAKVIEIRDVYVNNSSFRDLGVARDIARACALQNQSGYYFLGPFEECKNAGYDRHSNQGAAFISEFLSTLPSGIKVNSDGHVI